MLNQSTASLGVVHVAHPADVALCLCADTILGVRMLVSAAGGACAFKGGQECSSYSLIGAIIASASTIDLLLSFLVGHGYDKYALFFLRKLTRKVWLLIETRTGTHQHGVNPHAGNRKCFPECRGSWKAACWCARLQCCHARCWL